MKEWKGARPMNRHLSIPRLRIRKGKASKTKAGRPILRQDRNSLTEKARQEEETIIQKGKRKIFTRLKWHYSSN